MLYTNAHIRAYKTSGGTRYRGLLRWSMDETGEDGTSRRVWHEKNKTLEATGKQAAKRELDAWRAEEEAEAVAKSERAEAGITDADSTVGDYLERFMDDLESAKAVEPSTIRGYRTSLHYVQASAFADTRLADLTPDSVKKWEAHMLRPKSKGGMGLSSATVGKAHRLLKQGISEAVNLRVVQWNPLNAVKPPKRNGPRPNALDKTGRTEILARLDACEPTPIVIAAKIALYTGLREGECCGLMWKDVDLEGRVMWVRRSIGCGSNGTYVKNPKTDKVRDVPIPNGLLTVLRARMAAQRPEFMAAGLAKRFPAEAYVLGDVAGYLSPQRINIGWRALSSSWGIIGTEGRIPTFHDLRHTYATLAIAGGADVRVVSAALGHANAAMTLNTYASADPQAKKQLGKTVDSEMRNAPAEVAEFHAKDGTTGREAL